MSWYKPGRDPNHPGDSPPKWAPLSKTTRLALVVTVVAGVVIALLIIATRSAGATDDADAATIVSEPSPSWWVSGQRIEMPAAEVAVTIPEDWVAELDEEGSELSILILAQADRFGPRVDLQSLLVAEGPTPQGRDTGTGCSLVRYAPIDLTADEFLHEVFGHSDLIVVESLRDGLSRVLVNSWLQSRILAEVPEAIYGEHFAIADDHAVAVLGCAGVASHRDTWLAIAESVEFLPAVE